jgi:hypothetical protein
MATGAHFAINLPKYVVAATNHTIPEIFLTKVGSGKTVKSEKKRIISSQGDAVDAVFLVQAGKVKLTVVSQQVTEAVIAILAPASFFGEACLAGETFRMATATSLDEATILRIEKQAMLDVLHQELAFPELFMGYLLSRNFASKKIWWINSSIPARRGWPGFCYSWPLRQRQTTGDRHCQGRSRSRHSFLNKLWKLGF